MVNAYSIYMQQLKVQIYHNEPLGSAGGKLNIQERNTIFPVTTVLQFALSLLWVFSFFLIFFSPLFFSFPKVWIN